MSTPVLYDAPGPRAKTLNVLFSLLGFALIAWVLWVIYSKFDETGQWDKEKWTPFLEWNVWNNFLIPGIIGTLQAFVVGGVLALIFGLVFGVGRMSQSRTIRLVSGAVVEFFRSIPLLLLMFFLYYAQQPLLGIDSNLFLAVVGGLVLYNGSVLAEVIRAGVQSLPRGQQEAGLAVGLTKTQVLISIELPQAIRAMLPAIIAQLVVLLKDSALGYIIGYNELLNQLPKLDVNHHNLIPAAIVIAAIYIAMNSSLSGFANWLEKRMRRSGKTKADVGDASGLQPLPGTSTDASVR